ncbi:hypothetical protein [Enterovirga sp.]|jgi:hypothetical protein|uniref:hypothetical protein n=1 Tax=Enterovirga sp. TaxID=2026350 RepID=UPI0026104263|nr:hypothetical protein [Enterovirga sp.]MDB5592836.1 hypothetical protein [Enterovirga sp.]
MTPAGRLSDFGASSLSIRCDAFLLGRLGSEVARIYQDTLHSPVPARLQALVDQLTETSKQERETGPGD